MTDAHTPGLLTFDERGIIRFTNAHGHQEPVKIASAWREGAWDGNPEAIANARLYAAASDLLEACRLAVGPLGSTGPTPAYEAVLAAIAKATATEQGERG